MDTVPILGITLALVVMLPPSILVFSWTPIGRALTQRIKGQTKPDSEKLDEVLGAVYDLQNMMDHVGADVEELQDRVSFAERMLTAGAEHAKESTPV